MRSALCRTRPLSPLVAALLLGACSHETPSEGGARTGGSGGQSSGSGSFGGVPGGPGPTGAGGQGTPAGTGGATTSPGGRGGSAGSGAPSGMGGATGGMSGGTAGAAGSPAMARDGGMTLPPGDGASAITNHGCRLVPNAMGWIDARSNNAGVQGAVFTYASKDSMITPLTSTTMPFTNAGDGKLCIKGAGARVLNMEYGTYYGAAMGIDVCYDNVAAKKHTLSTCPYGKSLAGIRFTVTGATIPSELRVTFNEAGRTANTYVLASQGANEALFANGKVLYDMLAPPVNADNIDSIHFLIPTNVMQAVPFDFCVEKVELLTKAGMCDMGASTPMPMPTPMDGAGGSAGNLTGTMPTNVSAADFTGGYDAWKAAYVRSCGARGSYVANPQDGNSAYSEGIGYGMMLAVAAGDRTLFDALWTYYQANVDGNGLMHWRIAGCGGPSGMNSATDGDIDTAMALIQASCKWGSSYAQPARDLIGKIKAREIVVQNGLQVVKPGDAFNDATCVNPSYMAPGFFRAFGRFTSDAAFWDKVATDSYTIINRLAHATTGLVPNWGHTDGSAPHGECNRPDARLYSYDAARTPWRIATDYRFWGTEAARTLLTKHVAFAKQKGIDSIGDKYNLDGSVVNGFHTPVTTGAFATATVVSDGATANQFYQALRAVTVNEYFPTTLKLLYLAFGAGKFDRCVQ